MKKRDIYKSGDTKIPSVTTIIGAAINKPFLVPWASKMAVERVREMWTADTPHDQALIDAILEEAKGAHRKKLTDAGEFGSNIHSLVGAYVEGQLSLDMVGDPNEHKSLENFIKVTEGWEWLGSEQVVVHDNNTWADSINDPKSDCLPYGGTADAIARLPSGETVIVDFKTSTGVYPEMSLQIAMYAYAQPVDERLRETWSQITDGRILHFNKERLTWEVLERDIKSHYPFIPHFRQVYEWVNTLGK